MEITKKIILEQVSQVLSEQMAFLKKFGAKFGDEIANAIRRGESISGAIKTARGITRAEREIVDAIDAVVEHTRIHSRGGRQTLPKDTDELLKAVAGQGVKLSDDQWRQLYTGFFKAENVPMTFLDDMAKDLVQNPKFISRYGKVKTEKGLISQLKGKGYSDNSVNSIINAINEPENIGKFYGAGATTGGGRPRGGGKTPPRNKPPRGSLGTYLKTKRRMMIAGAVAKAAFIGAGAFGIYWLWKNFFSDVVPEDDMDSLQPILDRLNKFLTVRPCILDILDDEGVTLEIDEKGYLIVKMPKTGVAEYDQAGGLGFFDYGITYKINTPKAIGTYNCKGGNLAEEYYTDLIESILFEQEINQVGDNNPNTGLGGFTIKWQTDAQGNALGRASAKFQGTNCDNKPLPHPKGCFSAEIGEVQSCIPGLRIDGVLGDTTINKLTAMGYDMSQGLTKEIYDAVMAKCGKQTSQRQNPTQPEQQKP